MNEVNAGSSGESGISTCAVAAASVCEPFSYELPEQLIAQRPVYPPESARMLVVERATGTIAHRTFADLPALLGASDHLVFNDTRVLPARLFGALPGRPESSVELLLLRDEGGGRWECIGRPLRKIRAAKGVVFSPTLRADLVASPSDERIVVQFHTSSAAPLTELIRAHGSMPIPPYIRQGRADARDLEDYQTVFAQHDGSVAAPTAALHFSSLLLERLERESRCRRSHLTLHVGAASFKPVYQDGALRAPESEQFCVPADVLQAVAATRAQGGRVIAVGTTVVRALESAARLEGTNAAETFQDTGLFIQPGFSFELVSALVTNFHQPGTTHLLLVEALLGRDLLARAYREALTSGYRFLSYGDGMLIV